MIARHNEKCACKLMSMRPAKNDPHEMLVVIVINLAIRMSNIFPKNNKMTKRKFQ